MLQSFEGLPVTALACDFWDGNDAQCDLFQQVAGISFPVLRNASGLGAPTMYNCTYHYAFVIDGDGIVRYRGAGSNLQAIRIIIEQAVDLIVSVDHLPPAAVSLDPIYPNPFNPTTRIPFTLAEPADLTVDVVDVRGRLVRNLASGRWPAGRHEVVWDGHGMPSGTYVARLRAGGQEQSRLMSLVK